MPSAGEDATRETVRLPQPGEAAVRHAAPLLVAICAAAFLLRLLVMLFLPNIYRPDEIFQTIEQAHRIVYGTGVVPWEYAYGARSYLLPGALAGIMWVSKLVGAGPAYYLPATYGTLAALSTGCVVVAYLWAQRFFGVAGGIAAAIVVALSVDAIYFGARTSPEVIGAHVILIAAYLSDPGYLVRSRRRLFIAGLLFGLGVLLRFQYAPTIAFIWLWIAVRRQRSWLPALLAGLTIAVALGGLIDGLTWSYPFESIWRNFIFNTEYGMASFFGVDPWYSYVLDLDQYWGAGAAVLVFLALVGSMRLPFLLLAAMLNLALHSLIAHKEFGFIYLTILFIVVLAAIGMAEIVIWTSARISLAGSPRRAAQACSVAAAVFWAVFSLGEASSSGYMSHWLKARNELRAALAVSRIPSVCGVGLDGVEWYYSGGYTYMNEPGRLYFPTNSGEFRRESPGFNTLLYRGDLLRGLGFTNKQCFHDVCIAQRPGGCAPIPAMLTPQLPRMLRDLTPERSLNPQ
jgi:hypothetical protein